MCLVLAFHFCRRSVYSNVSRNVAIKKNVQTTNNHFFNSKFWLTSVPICQPRSKNLPKSAPNRNPPLSQALPLKVWQPWVESEWRFAKPTNNWRAPKKWLEVLELLGKIHQQKNTLPNFEDEKKKRHNNWRSWFLFIISLCHRKSQNVAWPLLRGRGGNSILRFWSH